MGNSNIIFIIELMNNVQIVNSYTLLNTIFLTINQNDLILSLTEIFNKMIDDLTYSSKLETIGVWSDVKFYLLDGEIKSVEIIKTKNEMNQYSSYGEGVLLIYNQIINNN